VSAASLPLPTGAATAAKQPAIGTAGTPSADVITVQGTTSMTALKVDGSGVTQPVSGTITANQGGSWSVSGSGNFAQGETNSAGINQAHVGCDKSVVYDASTSGATQLVALVSGKSIYICGYNIFSAGTANVKLESASAASCGGTVAALTPAYQLIAQTGMSYG